MEPPIKIVLNRVQYPKYRQIELVFVNQLTYLGSTVSDSLFLEGRNNPRTTCNTCLREFKAHSAYQIVIVKLLYHQLPPVEQRDLDNTRQTTTALTSLHL